MLRFGIQKSGRLTDQSFALIAECGIRFERSNGRLKVPAWNFALELMSFRDDDIPSYVADGVIDAAIVGENVVREQGLKFDVVRTLGFGKCRLVIATPKESSVNNPSQLSGLRIATTYPKLLSAYISEKNITAEIHEISGAAEIAPGIGLADAICDLVSSGSTLFSNGLKDIATVMFSEAILIVSPKISKENLALFSELDFRITAVLSAKKTKYIMLNIETEKIPLVANLLPGLKSPSVISLVREGWSALHTVVDEDNFWEIIGSLKEIGAEGILVLPIEKVIS